MLGLIVLASCTLLLLRCLWSRRRFYYLSLKINGPIGWPLIGNALEFLDSSKVLNKVLEIARTYESPCRFWLGWDFLICFRPLEEAETILTSPDLIDRGDLYKHIKYMVGGDSLINISGEEGWKFHRKMLSPTVQNYNVLNSFVPIFNKNIRIMTEILENKVGKGSFDIYHSLEACSFDIVCETICGVAMNIQGGENLSFMEYINNLMFISGIVIMQPWYRFYPIYRLSKYYQMGEESRRGARLYVKRILDGKIKKYKSLNLKGEMQKTSYGAGSIAKRPVQPLIDEFARLAMESNCFSEEQMISEAISIMSGGFESTSLSEAYIVLMLALHPEYQEKVFEELRNIFPEQRSDVTAEDIAKFQYTEQFIKETMRYTPVFPLLNRIAKMAFKTGEHTIPAGTQLIVSIISLHRNPLVWGEKANVFDPDHFLPEACMKRHPYSFIPFSAGLRNCIAMKYANIQIRMFVAWIVRNYRFTTDLKIEELNFKFNVTMKLAQNHMVRIHKRENY